MKGDREEERAFLNPPAFSHEAGLFFFLSRCCAGNRRDELLFFKDLEKGNVVCVLD